jgi:hypothetical protein
VDVQSDLRELHAAWAAASPAEREHLCASGYRFRVCSHEGRVDLSFAEALRREHEFDRSSPADFSAAIVEEKVSFTEDGWVTRRRLRVSGDGREVTALVCHVVTVEDGKVALFEEYYDPTDLRAAFPGRYYVAFTP